MNRGLKWKLVLGFLLVFIAGATTGAFLGASHSRQLFLRLHHRQAMSDRMLHRLRVQLQLSDEQSAKITPIVDKTILQLDEIRRNTGRRVHEIIADSHREMATVLTDEQRAKLQEIEARHRRWHERVYGGRESASAGPEKPPE